MSNVVQLFPKKQKTAPAMVPRIKGLEELISSTTDWAENEGVNVYDSEFIYFLADFMQRLQIMAHLAKSEVA